MSIWPVERIVSPTSTRTWVRLAHRRRAPFFMPTLVVTRAEAPSAAMAKSKMRPASRVGALAKA